MFVLAGEIFPPHLKGRLIAIQQCGAAVWGALAQFLFPVAADAGGYGLAFLCHSLACLAGLGMLRGAFIETLGIEPEEACARLERDTPLGRWCAAGAPRGAGASASAAASGRKAVDSGELELKVVGT